ncbi:ERB1 [Malassezia furfur]|nr:ERB1 [Malassezia furfur]
MSARRAAPSRKRATPGAAPAAARVRAQREPGLDTLAQSLELGGDDDAEVEEEGEEEPFPELDAGDDDEDEEEDEDEDEEEDDDDDAGSGSGSGSGFDSDEIDDWDEAKDELYGDVDATAGDLSDAEEGDAALARMIARARAKPDERAPSTNRLGIDRAQAARLYDDARNDDGSFRGRVVRSAITGENKMAYPEIEPEYDSDSSTEETENRIGNVPLHWYDDLPHLGYDINGKRVLRPAQGDELDKFLDTVDGEGDAFFSARDQLGGKDVRLTDEELDIIRRLQRAEIPLDSYDPYEPATDWFTQHQLATPMSARPEPKSRFVPSKWEHKKVMKIVRAIRQGRIVAHAPGKERAPFYNLWSDADVARADHAMHMPAPKLPLPSHVESYNPPAEYLFSDAERAEWEAADPEDRKLPYIPTKYAALRLVPGYDAAVQERFQRCLDLYLAPRVRRQRLDIERAEDLLPQLPSPRELRPFPTHTDVVYAHAGRVRTAAPDPTGTWLLTGADDGLVRLWDLALGRCVASWDMNAGIARVDHGPVYCVAWAPTRQYALAAVASAGRVSLLAPPMCAPRGDAVPAAQVAAAAFATAAAAPDAGASGARWARPSDAERAAGVCVHVHLSAARGAKVEALVPKQVVWHARADYFATVCPDAGAHAVLIHQVSKHRSQAPFRRARRQSSAAYAVQCVAFHPHRPLLFVATQRYVRVFDLVQQALHKTLQPGVRWISSMDVHPSGDHLLVGSYDRRVLWFDLDLSERPYKTLRYHTKAVRAVAFSPRFPLFASAADDGTVHIYHATVYADLLKNALLVPLKVLRGHRVADALGVLAIHWHPTLPWLLSAGADGDARLWTP